MAKDDCNTLGYYNVAFVFANRLHHMGFYQHDLIWLTESAKGKKLELKKENWSACVC